MSERLLEYLSVLLSSTVKFIFGPIQGVAYGLGWLETALLTASGMMLSVFFFTYFGRFLKQRFFKREKLFTPKNRRNVRLWRKFGIYGVAALTPLLLTPIGGAILANSFGEKKSKIFFWMLISAIVWGTLLTLMVYRAEDLFTHLHTVKAQT